MSMSCGSKGLVVMVILSLLTIGSSDAKSIVVGGSEGWHFGVNYTDWAIRSSPFFINDKLVFKYDTPSDGRHTYNVYLLASLESFLACDFEKAEVVANASQGSEEGFEVELSEWKPYYFASYGQGDASHCNDGLMKLVAVPWPRLA